MRDSDGSDHCAGAAAASTSRPRTWTAMAPRNSIPRQQMEGLVRGVLTRLSWHGAVRSKNLEMRSMAQVSSHWVLAMSFALDVKETKDVVDVLADLFDEYQHELLDLKCHTDTNKNLEGMLKS